MSLEEKSNGSSSADGSPGHLRISSPSSIVSSSIVDFDCPDQPVIPEYLMVALTNAVEAVYDEFQHFGFNWEEVWTVVVGQCSATNDEAAHQDPQKLWLLIGKLASLELTEIWRDRRQNLSTPKADGVDERTARSTAYSVAVEASKQQRRRRLSLGGSTGTTPTMQRNGRKSAALTVVSPKFESHSPVSNVATVSREEMEKEVRNYLTQSLLPHGVGFRDEHITAAISEVPVSRRGNLTNFNTCAKRSLLELLGVPVVRQGFFEVLPQVLLGSLETAEYEAELVKNQITHVVLLTELDSDEWAKTLFTGVDLIVVTESLQDARLYDRYPFGPRALQALRFMLDARTDDQNAVVAVVDDSECLSRGGQLLTVFVHRLLMERPRLGDILFAARVVKGAHPDFALPFLTDTNPPAVSELDGNADNEMRTIFDQSSRVPLDEKLDWEMAVEHFKSYHTWFRQQDKESVERRLWIPLIRWWLQMSVDVALQLPSLSHDDSVEETCWDDDDDISS